MTRTPHTPREMKVSDGSLWGDTPWHPHVRMARIIEHSPMNGMDADHLANELAKRWNCHEELLEALILCHEQLSLWTMDESHQSPEDKGALDRATAVIVKAKGIIA